MNNELKNFEQACRQIESGRCLVITSDESFLSRLPKGNWIGATTPYAMSSDGGECTDQKAYIQELPPVIKSSRVKVYQTGDISSVYADAYPSGFSVILIPAFTDMHVKFANEVPTYKGFGQTVLMGWISGTKLDVLGKQPARVFDGSSGKSYSDAAVVMHFQLPDNKYADMGIINIFEPTVDGDVLSFEEEGLSPSKVLVNGKPELFADYIERKNVNIKWPMVSDYHGAGVNVSFLSVDNAKKEVKLVGPVFRGLEYRLAKPMANYGAYLEAFRRQVSMKGNNEMALTCNCIFNYLYGELEGKRLDELNGPFVFGEIAYQLLNQTLVYVSIHDRQ